MINVYECLTDDAKIHLTKDYNYRRSFFKRKDDELYIKEFEKRFLTSKLFSHARLELNVN